jgi:hypothetical protein
MVSVNPKPLTVSVTEVKAESSVWDANQSEFKIKGCKIFGQLLRYTHRQGHFKVQHEHSINKLKGYGIDQILLK